jgi:hypothetical protein
MFTAGTPIAPTPGKKLGDPQYSRIVHLKGESVLTWAILIAVLEVLAVYFLLTIVSSMWQRRISNRPSGDDHDSISFSA